MSNIFNHILKSNINDPLLFLKDLIKDGKLEQAIENFLPNSNISEGKGGNKIVTYEPIEELRNINYKDLSYEIKKIDKEYRLPKRGGTKKQSNWVKESFHDHLLNELNKQIMISWDLMVELMSSHILDFEQVEFIYHPKIKSLISVIESSKKFDSFPQIKASLLELIEQSTESNCVTTSLSQSLKQTAKVVNKRKIISVSNFKTLHKKIAEYDKKFAIAEIDFINAMIQICKNGIPNKKLYIYFGNQKTFYFLLSKLKKSYDIDYKKLEAYIVINESSFDSLHMKDFPSTAHKSYRALISNWYEKI